MTREEKLYKVFLIRSKIFRRHYFTKYARVYWSIQVATPLTLEKYAAFIYLND